MSLPTPILAGNWKLHHGPDATRGFFRDFLSLVPAGHAGSIAICPPALSLTTARAAIKDRSDILLGVQNVYWEPSGAFTGEISAPLAKEAGADLVLIGHSERRHVFGESDGEAGRKVAAALRAGLIAVLCVGETLDEREAGNEVAMVERQFRAGLAASEVAEETDRLIIAYEPVWAIGTGRTASPQDASAMHQAIRALVEDAFGAAGAAVPILYGGSVKPENARELLAAPGIDGLLVGGASLDPRSFAAICGAGT